MFQNKLSLEIFITDHEFVFGNTSNLKVCLEIGPFGDFIKGKNYTRISWPDKKSICSSSIVGLSSESEVVRQREQYNQCLDMCILQKKKLFFFN